MSDYALVRAAARLAGRDRILIDGVDRTYFRDALTTWDSYQLTEPFAYGPTTLTFPKIHATEETPGVGELAWLRKGAEVRIERRDRDTDALIATDHVGVLLSPRRSGRALTMEVGGQFSGRASLIEKHQRAVRYVGDVGHLAQLCLGSVNLPMVPWNGPVTGVKRVDSGAGVSMADWAATVCAMSLSMAGQRTIMPTTWGGPTWGMPLKDTTTVHGTVFADPARVVIDLFDDIAEQPNVWYGTGITPEGVRIRNIRYPGLKQGPPAEYPIAGGGSFGTGTTDADTVNLDGITVLQIKLQQMSYLGWDNPITGVYDDVTASAVKRLKADVKLTVNGTMTSNAWDRLWDITATGSSLNGAKPFPLVVDPRVEPYLYSSNGSVIGLNPDFDSTIPRVGRTIDFGPGWTKQQMVDWCLAEQARTQGKNLVGTITLNDFGAWVGDWGPGDYAMLNDRPDLILGLRDIRPGMNLKAANVDGGTLFHVSGVTVTRSGDNITATLLVDTQARDALEVAALRERDSEARRNIRRDWMKANVSNKPSGNMIQRDEFFGRLFQKVALNGGEWSDPIWIPAGQSGQINKIVLQLKDGQECEFAYVLTRKKLTPAELHRIAANPLAKVAGGDRPWYNAKRNAHYFREKIILAAAGTFGNPCGYWPDMKTDENGKATGADLTGEWVYANSVPYITGTYDPGMLFLYVYPVADTTLKAGQVLWAQEDDVN